MSEAHRTNQAGLSSVAELLTRSILATLCLRRRRLCLRISCEDELCSVELLSLKHRGNDEGKPGAADASKTPENTAGATL